MPGGWKERQSGAAGVSRLSLEWRVQGVQIELVYFSGCPNVDAARTAVRSALRSAGLPEAWREWDQTDPATPDGLCDYASPTVLVGGVDVTGAGPGSGGLRCCAGGAPSAAAIGAALRTSPST